MEALDALVEQAAGEKVQEDQVRAGLLRQVERREGKLQDARLRLAWYASPYRFARWGGAEITLETPDDLLENLNQAALDLYGPRNEAILNRSHAKLVQVQQALAAYDLAQMPAPPPSIVVHVPPARSTLEEQTIPRMVNRRIIQHAREEVQNNNWRETVAARARAAGNPDFQGNTAPATGGYQWPKPGVFSTEADEYLAETRGKAHSNFNRVSTSFPNYEDLDQAPVNTNLNRKTHPVPLGRGQRTLEFKAPGPPALGGQYATLEEKKRAAQARRRALEESRKAHVQSTGPSDADLKAMVLEKKRQAQERLRQKKAAEEKAAAANILAEITQAKEGDHLMDQMLQQVAGPEYVPSTTAVPQSPSAMYRQARWGQSRPPPAKTLAPAVSNRPGYNNQGSRLGQRTRQIFNNTREMLAETKRQAEEAEKEAARLSLEQMKAEQRAQQEEWERANPGMRYAYRPLTLNVRDDNKRSSSSLQLSDQRPYKKAKVAVVLGEDLGPSLNNLMSTDPGGLLGDFMAPPQKSVEDILAEFSFNLPSQQAGTQVDLTDILNQIPQDFIVDNTNVFADTNLDLPDFVQEAIQIAAAAEGGAEEEMAVEGGGEDENVPEDWTDAQVIHNEEDETAID